MFNTFPLSFFILTHTFWTFGLDGLLQTSGDFVSTGPLEMIGDVFNTLPAVYRMFVGFLPVNLSRSYLQTI